MITDGRKLFVLTLIPGTSSNNGRREEVRIRKGLAAL
jgi:hypothetical protein